MTYSQTGDSRKHPATDNNSVNTSVNTSTSVAPESAELTRLVLAEQVIALYRRLPVILAINAIVGSMMIFGLWNVVSQQALLIWGGALAFSIVLRALSYIRFRRTTRDKIGRLQAFLFTMGSGLTGTIWGCAGIFLFPDHVLEYQLFILFVLVGMGAGAISSLTAYMPAFYAFFVPSMTPVCILLLSMGFGEPIQLSLGVMSLSYVFALCFFGLNINRSLTQTLKLRFENVNLVRELSEQKEQAEQANIAKSKFLAAASHDLRQPLHALTLFTSVLDESIQYPKVRRVVEQINGSVNALQTLFNALLDISRLDAGVMETEKTSFRLQPLFDKLANEFNLLAGEKRLALIWPNCSYTIYSDPTLLEQILRNYVSNAIRYTHQGEIRIVCQETGGLLSIQVQDTGIGIAPEDQQSIFTEFFQLANPERDSSKGLGLGLAIVERTAGLLQHAINVESIPGQGSTFSISVDISNDLVPSVETSKQVQVESGAKSDTTIVVIDDDWSAREGTKALLDTWGYDAVVTADLDEALRELKNQGKIPTGIIADYRLRAGRTGIEAIKRLHKEYHAGIPALIVTGDIAKERLQEVSESGYQLLHKPVSAVKLRAFARNVNLRKQQMT